jgi:hypothetical protein
MSVGTNRFSGDPDAFAQGVRLFTFVARAGSEGLASDEEDGDVGEIGRQQRA